MIQWSKGSFSSFQNLSVERHLSDFNWLAWIMSRLKKATHSPLILPDGISLKRGKKGGWKPVFKVNIYYLVSVLFAPNYWPSCEKGRAA